MLVVHLDIRILIVYRTKHFVLPELGSTNTSVSSCVALSTLVKPSTSYLFSLRYFKLNFKNKVVFFFSLGEYIYIRQC